jgi:2-hydroxychromene-2-carboxylate isomerase
MPATIDYFFGPQSPWSFLGHERFAALVARSKAEVRVIPCDLLHVFNASGGLPLAKRPPQRQAYRMIELRRFAAHLAIPLNLNPKFFPVSGDPGARVIIATDLAHGAIAALALAGDLGHALWCEEADLADPATLARIAGQRGLDGATLVAASASDAVARRYEANTQEAIERGVFGAPTYCLDGEPFWGQDRLEFLERALARRPE